MLHLALLVTLGFVNAQWIPWPWWTPGTPACSPSGFPADNCPCDYGRCSWWGDPHTTTFDGLYHGFQGWPGYRYRYVTPCKSNFVRVPFQILTEHRACGWITFPWQWFTCTQYVDVRLYTSGGGYSQTLRLDNGLSLRSFIEPGFPGANIADGVYNYANGYYTVRRYNNYYMELSVYTDRLCPAGWWVFQNPPRADFTVRVNSGMSRVDVFVNEYYFEAVCGLCGFWNNDVTDDFSVAQLLWGFFPQCFQFSTVGFPTSLWSYNWSHWWRLFWWGFYYQDFGVYTRRLQEGNVPEEPPQSDPDNPEAVRQQLPAQPDGTVQPLPPQDPGRQALEEEFLLSCDNSQFDCIQLAGEIATRIDSTDCQGDVQRCMRNFCSDACINPNGCGRQCRNQPPNDDDATTTNADDVPVREVGPR